MAYGPSDLSIAAVEDRPYGQTAQELIDQRERRAAAQQSAPATPMPPPPQADPGGAQRNPGDPMDFGGATPPPPDGPPPGGQEMLGHPGGANLGDFSKFAKPIPTADWPSDVGNVLAGIGHFKDLLTDPLVRERFYSQMEQSGIPLIRRAGVGGRFTEQMMAPTYGQRQSAGLEDPTIDPLVGGAAVAAGGIERSAARISESALAKAAGSVIAEDASKLVKFSETQLKMLLELAPDAATKKVVGEEIARRGVAQATKEADVLERSAAALESSGRKAEAAMLREEADVTRAGFGSPPEVDPTAAKAAKQERKMPLAVPKPPVTPFEGTAAQETGSITRTEAARPLVYPKEENLGIPKADLESMPSNIRDLVVKEARANYDEIQQARGGVVPRSQVDRESERILIDAGYLSQVAPRTPVSAPGMIALRRALRVVTSQRDAIEIEAKALGPERVSDDLRASFAVKVFEQNSIQRVIAGGRAEWGRLGQAMQDAEMSGDRVRIANMKKQVIKAIGGKDGVDEIMSRLDAIKNDPNLLGIPYAPELAQLKFINDIRRPTTWAKLREAWVNSILSIPVTHEAYVFGQGIFHQVEALAALPTAAVDEVVSRLERRGAGAERYTFNQALVEVAAREASIPSGLLAGFNAIKTGYTSSEVELFGTTGRLGRQHALEGSAGTVLRLPTRIIGGYTAAFHEVGRRTSLLTQATKMAEDELPGKNVLNADFRRRVAEIAANPTAEMETVARAAGQRASLRNENPNALASLLRTFRDMEVPSKVPVLGGARPLYRVMPFINIGFNVASLGLEYSPAGIARAAYKSGVERSAAISHAAIGSLIWKYFWDQADQGNLTGARPTDPNEAALWERDGRQPYSLKVGNEWYPIDRFEPIASTVKWISGIQTVWKDVQAQGRPLDIALAESTIAKIGSVMLQGYLDMSWMTGISQLVQIGRTPSGDKAAAINNYLGQQAAAQLPFSGGMKRTAQAVDPYIRQPSGIEQQIEAVIPGLSALVPPVMGRYGENLQRPESQQGLRGMIDFRRGTVEQHDPVDEELAKHTLPQASDSTGAPIDPKQIFMGLASKEIDRFKLTSEEGRMVQQLSGRAAHQALAELFAGKSTYNGQRFDALSEPDKSKAIVKAINDARRSARAATADAIMQQAKAAPEVVRAADMRLSLISDRADRALYLEGVQRQGKLTPQASSMLSTAIRTKKADEPTVAEYLRAAPGVRSYVAIPPFRQGDPNEWQQVEQQRSAYNEVKRIDAIDGTKNAIEFYKAHPLLAKYERIVENPDRALYRAKHPELKPYLSGLTYTQEKP